MLGPGCKYPGAEHRSPGSCHCPQAEAAHSVGEGRGAVLFWLPCKGSLSKAVFYTPAVLLAPIALFLMSLFASLSSPLPLARDDKAKMYQLTFSLPNVAL